MRESDATKRIRESKERVRDAAKQMVETSAALRLTVDEFDRAVELAKKMAIISEPSKD